MIVVLSLIFTFTSIFADDFPVIVEGADEASFAAEGAEPEPFPEKVDAIVVGGGLSGLTAALYLSDSNLRVLVLEKEQVLGGLASGATENGIRYNRGAAYWTPAYEEEREILTRIGIGDYEKHYSIHEPIDCYLWNGKLYPDVWESEETLSQLPASFKLFKNELEIANDQNLIPNQPMEHAANKALDRVSALRWIRTMPRRAATRLDEKSKKIYEEFLADKTLSPNDRMKELLEFVDLFSRSALGTTTDKISALAFANFYISEIDTRFASEIGTGVIAEKMIAQLSSRGNVKLLTRAKVVEVEGDKESVRVVFQINNKTKFLDAPYAVFAAPLKMAAKVVKKFKERSPEQYALFESVGYAHYSVHTVWTKGHPYRATYDTWTRDQKYTEDDFSDVINGRWQDPRINGYTGMRDFKKHPEDDMGILTVYHPLPSRWVGNGYLASDAEMLARRATLRLKEMFNPLLQATWGTEIVVRKVETYRWPFSIHLVRPGYFSKIPVMRKPFGRIYFANNNLGTPAIEEALFRGHCAATNIRRSLDPQFKVERWTHCPLE